MTSTVRLLPTIPTIPTTLKMIDSKIRTHVGADMTLKRVIWGEEEEGTVLLVDGRRHGVGVEGEVGEFRHQRQVTIRLE